MNARLEAIAEKMTAACMSVKQVLADTLVEMDAMRQHIERMDRRLAEIENGVVTQAEGEGPCSG